MAGAEPAVIDVDSTTWALSLNLLERFISSGEVAAVVLVSPFGLRQDFLPHLQLCTERGLPVLIDSAAGLNTLATPPLKESGFEIYSLHATKAFPIGEGGVIRSRAEQAPALRRALNFGLEAGRAAPGCWGINGKLPEISAAVGLAVLKEFDAVIRHRKAAAARYINFLQEYDGLIFPTDVDGSPWQVFPVLLPSGSSAEIFMQRAAAESLQVRWGYKPTLENWPHTRSMSACPNAESLSERTVTLPIYSDMTEDEHNAILEIMRRSLDHALLA
jgi:dTDP-4-amino-4,6-dideoxygalactose transaminase